jgi:hypothetical protein
MSADLAGTDSPSLCRALVPLAAASPGVPPHRPIRRATAFLTHVIATAQQLPQARARRRAEPAEGIAAYQAAIARLQTLGNQ